MTKLLFLVTAVYISFVGTLAFASLPPQTDDSNSAEQKAYIQNHKAMMFLNVKAIDGNEVVFTFNKSSWFYKQSKYDNLFKKIRIYRRKINCIFGKDNKEFFDGMVCGPSDILYEGRVKCEQNKNFTYTDKSVIVGETYAYWAGLSDGLPSGPAAVKIRDPQVWWSMDKIAKAAAELEKTYPKLVKVKTIGRTVMGRDVLGIEVGKSRKKVAIIGGMHAAEAGPELIIYAIKTLLDEHRDIFKDVGIVAIPCVNMDERQKMADGNPWYLRRNTASVDLNRNYPGDWQQVSFMYGCDSSLLGSGTYRGCTPASEPETQAVISFIKHHRPSVLFSFHHLACVAGRVFLAPAAAAKDETYKQYCQKVCDIYTQGYCNGYTDEDPNKGGVRFTGTPGAIPTWCYREFSIPAFDVEWHSHPSLEKSLIDETDIETLGRNQKQHTAALLSLLKSME